MKNEPGYGKTLQNGLCTKQTLSLIGFKKDSFLICINKTDFSVPTSSCRLDLPWLN